MLSHKLSMCTQKATINKQCSEKSVRSSRKEKRELEILLLYEAVNYFNQLSFVVEVLIKIFESFVKDT